MPELPDLQVFSHNLNKRFAGEKLKIVTVFKDKQLNVSSAELKENLEGQVLNKIIREGKELHFYFKNDQVLGLHLMLKGQLHYFEEKNQFKNKVIELLFENGTGLAMSDPFGRATPTLNPKPANAPDALSDVVNASFLKKELEKAKGAIKPYLLDQKRIRGIGNAYADEILWDAGISPFSACNKIPAEKVKDLAKSIKSVLHDAEKQIIKADPEIISGEIRNFLKVHTPGKTHTPSGEVIHTKELKSRKTYYTDEQKLYE